MQLVVMRPRPRPIGYLKLGCCLTLAALEGLRIASHGFPLDRPTLFILAMLFGAVFVVGQPNRKIRELVIDWIPLAVILTAYDLGRGAADALGIGTSFELAPALDYRLTGTIPTVWLQQHLYGDSFQHWWNIPLSLLYISHFVVPMLTFAVLWVRARPRFHQYVRRFVLLTLMGLLCYVLHPTAPPWLAAHEGTIKPVFRSAALGLEQIQLHVAKRILDTGVSTTNLVAAFPSLHAAYPMLLLLFCWRSHAVWRTLLTLYTVGMAFMLVATGEHWVVDVLAGWTFAALVHFGCRRYEARFG